MTPPTDKQTFEGEIATYWFDDGILISRSKSIKRTVANISGNVALVKELTGNKPVPLLIYLPFSGSGQANPEVFHHAIAADLFGDGNGVRTGTGPVHHEYFVPAKAAPHSHEKLYGRPGRKGVAETISIREVAVRCLSMLLE